MIWSVARGFRLDEAAAKDVSQTVWLRLVENIDRVSDPERLPGWLATTCRREALKVARARDRTIPTEFDHDVAEASPSLDELLVADEESRAVLRALRSLEDVCQRLLRLMTLEPALSYQEISDLLGRPVGSLGPTRARCIDKLRAAMAGISGSGGGS